MFALVVLVALSGFAFDLYCIRAGLAARAPVASLVAKVLALVALPVVLGLEGTYASELIVLPATAMLMVTLDLYVAARIASGLQR